MVFASPSCCEFARRAAVRLLHLAKPALDVGIDAASAATEVVDHDLRSRPRRRVREARTRQRASKDDAVRVCHPVGAVNFKEPGAAGAWNPVRIRVRRRTGPMTVGACANPNIDLPCWCGFRH